MSPFPIAHSKLIRMVGRKTIVHLAEKRPLHHDCLTCLGILRH